MAYVSIISIVVILHNTIPLDIIRLYSSLCILFMHLCTINLLNIVKNENAIYERYIQMVFLRTWPLSSHFIGKLSLKNNRSISLHVRFKHSSKVEVNRIGSGITAKNKPHTSYEILIPLNCFICIDTGF